MKVIALIYFALMMIEWFFMPFVFGKSRGTYTPEFWFWNIVFHLPLAYLLLDLMLHP